MSGTYLNRPGDLCARHQHLLHDAGRGWTAATATATTATATAATTAAATATATA
jgi:hypothetical protein